MSDSTVRFFLDTEFNDEIGDCRIEPISIGLVSEDARFEHYDVSNAFTESAAHPWLVQHVLPKLPPMEDRVNLEEMRSGVRAYFQAAAAGNPEATRAQIWYKNGALDQAVVAILFNGLSKFYAFMNDIGFQRSYFNDTDTLRADLPKELLPRDLRAPEHKHMALMDAHQERLEYLHMQKAKIIQPSRDVLRP